MYELVRRLLPGKSGRIEGRVAAGCVTGYLFSGLPQLTPVFWPRFPLKGEGGLVV